MERIEACFHRLFDLIDKKHYSPEGCGDCSICVQDEKNKECSQYTPISMLIVDVEKPKCFF